MKKTILLITIISIIIGCQSKKYITSKNLSVLEIKQKDSFLLEINKQKKINEKLKDSIVRISNRFESKETTTTKAAKLATEFESLCDSIGNLKNFTQTLGNNEFQLKIEAANGKLSIVSNQLKDIISTNEKLLIENNTLIQQSKEKEETYISEISLLQSKLKELKKENTSLKETKETKYRLGKIGVWSILLNVIFILVIVMLIRGKVMFWK